MLNITFDLVGEVLSIDGSIESCTELQQTISALQRFLEQGLLRREQKWQKHLMRFVDSGEKVKAIMYYRAVCGSVGQYAGLKEAKDFIEALYEDRSVWHLAPALPVDPENIDEINRDSRYR